MQEATHEKNGEVTRSTAGDVTARAVTIRQGGARSISAEELTFDKVERSVCRLSASRSLRAASGSPPPRRIHVTAGTRGRGPR